MELFTLFLILMTIWFVLCSACVIAGVFLGLKYRKEREPNVISKEDEQRLKKEQRELQNFFAYNGDSQK